MSFLSILLVASAFYFAHARPDSQSRSEAVSGAHANYEVVEDAPPVESSDDQHKLLGLMKDVSVAVDQYMTPLMSKLNVTIQDDLKSMGMNGFASYINYLLLLIQEKENEKDKGDDQTQGDSLPRDEMILEFISEYSLDSDTLFIAGTQDEKEA